MLAFDTVNLNVPRFVRKRCKFYFLQMRRGQCGYLRIGESNSSIGRAVPQLERLISIIFEPTSGRRLRSKNEVLHFLETGSKLRRRPNPNAYVRMRIWTLIHGDVRKRGLVQRPRRSGSTAKDPAEEVKWGLMDYSHGLSGHSIPFMGFLLQPTVSDQLAVDQYLNGVDGEEN